MSTSSALLLPSLHGDDVPADSRPLLDRIRKGFGYVPNLFAAFANSPVLLDGYMTLDAAFDKGHPYSDRTAAGVIGCERSQRMRLLRSRAQHCRQTNAERISSDRIGDTLRRSSSGRKTQRSRQSDEGTRSRTGSGRSGNDSCLPGLRLSTRSDRRGSRRHRSQDSEQLHPSSFAGGN